MQAKWVFEKDAYQDGNTERMIAYCKSKGILYQMVDYVVFGSDDHIKWQFGDDDCVVMYGTTTIAKHVQNKKKWYPGVWCDWEQLKCSYYLSRWGEHSVHQDYMFMPIGEVYRNWNKLWKQYNNYGHMFIKPDDNDKRFHGELIAGDRKDDWYKWATFYGAGPESLALVSRPTKIVAEWRMIVDSIDVLTGSLYRADGRTVMSRIDPDWDFDANAIQFAEKIIRNSAWKPAPIYPLDICLTDDNGIREFRLMEIGSINCCGLYKADTDIVMAAATDHALKAYDAVFEPCDATTDPRKF